MAKGDMKLNEIASLKVDTHYPNSWTQDIVAKLNVIFISVLPLFLYAFVEMGLLIPNVFGLSLIAAGFLVSLVLNYCSVTSQVRKTFTRNMEELHQQGTAAVSGSKKSGRLEKRRKRVLWSESMAYSFTASNLFFLGGFLVLHYKLFAEVSMVELRYALCVVLPAMLSYQLNK